MAQLVVELGEKHEHVALELRHLLRSDRVAAVEPVESAKQVAESVAELPILVRYPGEDLLPDAVILGEVDRQRPEP